MIEQCESCGKEFDPLDGGFVGDLSGNTECCFTTVITTLCETCYQKHEDTKQCDNFFLSH